MDSMSAKRRRVIALSSTTRMGSGLFMVASFEFRPGIIAAFCAYRHGAKESDCRTLERFEVGFCYFRKVGAAPGRRSCSWGLDAGRPAHYGPGLGFERPRGQA
ncbi:hypothetical protein MTBLM5_490008 [Magnetospirillum sp. LM-5]|nr:hypothetical protein MTBLM5_490008 [Magnetospirillum sp. LM-5]